MRFDINDHIEVIASKCGKFLAYCKDYRLNVVDISDPQLPHLFTSPLFANPEECAALPFGLTPKKNSLTFHLE